MPVELPDGRSLPDAVLEALGLRAIRARELGYSLREIADVLGPATSAIPPFNTLALTLHNLPVAERDALEGRFGLENAG